MISDLGLIVEKVTYQIVHDHRYPHAFAEFIKKGLDEYKTVSWEQHPIDKDCSTYDITFKDRRHA